MALRDLLVHPLMRGLNPDSPDAIILRRTVLREKGLLRRIYEEWYRSIVEVLPSGAGALVELGSGAGYLRDFVPGLVSSDVLMLPGLSAVLDAHAIPFRDRSLKAIIMIDVLHHLADAERFFHEAARCVRPEGALIMIEPWVTSWSTLVLSRFHHEPFDPHVAQWRLPESGPESRANQALPWIIFHRDRRTFESTFPVWQVRSITLQMPVSYILSGGLRMRSLVPGGAFRIVRFLERLATPWMDTIAMFARIVLERAANR
jgi:SAM-dependent methyltransferase